jgi:hypothetical protein
MIDRRTHRRVVRNRKKRATPLSTLRTSDAVKTVVAHPRRLEELLKMLEDKDRSVRGRAAAALAKLSESHPSRLLRVIVRLKSSLEDESAYVRWYLVYTLGKLGVRFPEQSREFLVDLVLSLEDQNRIVRILAGKALGQVALRKPLLIEDCFRNLRKEIPPSIVRLLRNSKAARST